MKLPRRNHYNPCFWTALWNSHYFRLAAVGGNPLPPAREQIVHVLSPKSGTSFRAKVKSVHYDKNLGIAEISREACEDFVQRYYPDRHGSFVHENGQVTYPVSTVDRLRSGRSTPVCRRTGLWRNGFDLADLDGDGEIDFVHGPPRRSGDQPRVFRGDGHGSWTSVPGQRAAGPARLRRHQGRRLQRRRQARPGCGEPPARHARFSSATAPASGPRGARDWTSSYRGRATTARGFSSRRLEVLDWNRDGRPDLVALSEGPSSPSLDPGDKAPRWLAVSAGGVRAEALPQQRRRHLDRAGGGRRPRPEIFGDDLAVADFDGNGSVDFLTSTNAMSRHDLLYLQGRQGRRPLAPVSPPLRPQGLRERRRGG